MSFSCFRPFGVWGVTFVFLDLQAHSFFAMFMLRSMCLCLDLCLFGPRVMPMLRSMCLCASCHACVLRSILVAMPCASIALLPLDISLSCFWSFRQGVDLDPVVQAYIHTPRPVSKGLDHFLLHVYVCMLAFMLYLHAYLSISRLCHALCPPWVCLCGHIHPSQGLIG